MKEKLKKLLKRIPFPITKNHGYDLLTRKIIKKHLHSDSNTIDVGCHKGDVLELMLKTAPTAQHWGFEPIPYLYATLKKKFKNNSNCHIHDYAICDQIGKSTFNHVITNPSYSGLLKRDYDKANESDEIIEVSTNTLDNVIPEEVLISMIKIDVEGGEYQVLKGARRIIQNHKPLIIFEHGLGSSEYFGSYPSKIFEFYDSYEMKISTLSLFIKNGKELSFSEFEKYYYDRTEYYFIAFPKNLLTID